MWFKVDDKLWSSPKWLAASPRARALWVSAGSYCADQLTDGVVTASVLRLFGVRTVVAEELVKVGLWERVDDGYRFHDWADWQRTKAQVKADRDATKERQQKWREARQSRRDKTVSNGVTDGVINTAQTRPDQTPPTPPSANTSPTSPTPTSADADGENDFTTFWALYPRKVNRTAATTAWRRTTRTHPAADILTGLRQQLPALEARDVQYVPHPDAWLRKERWLDDPTEPERDPWAHLPSLGPGTPDATA